MSPYASDEVGQLSRAVAAHGLADSRLDLPTSPVQPELWRRVLARIRTDRTSGHLIAAIEAGDFGVTLAQRSDAERLHKKAMVVCLHLERSLCEVVDAFCTARIGHRALKGCASAHLDYADPSLRSFGDIDLLVRSRQFDDAVSVLADMGYRRRYPQPRPGFDRRFTKSVSLVGPAGLEIDLHRTLADGPLGVTIDVDELWSDPQLYRVGGRELAALAIEDRFLHACYHAALGNKTPRLVALRDIVTILEGDPEVDVDTACEKARRWRGMAVVARGVKCAWDTFDLEHTGLSRWADEFSPTGKERRHILVYTRPTAAYGTKALATLRELPDLKSKAAFMWALGFPRGSYLRSRYRSRLERWSALVRRRRSNSQRG